ncbi:MAG: bifunctional cytidylyltransferase/SDR family oxidoreductase [Simkaniaceae bacterium]
MGGDGKRFGNSLPKQFQLLSGKKIYQHTLEVFLNSQFFQNILLVCRPDYVPLVLEETAKFAPLVQVVPGGKDRQASSYSGLLAADPCDIIMVHDAVRPFITEKILQENIEAAITCGAADTCIPSSDTLVHVREGFIEEIPDRDLWKRGQTPQTFQYALLKRAHQKALRSNISGASDDCQLVLRLGIPIKTILGSESNIKITSLLDLFLAEQLLRLPRQPCGGTQKTSLHGKLFAVTGGTGGIGNAICEALTKEGAKVIPISRSSKEYAADLQNFQQVRLVFDQIYKKFGLLDGLINAVGYLKKQPFLDSNLMQVEQTVQTNFSSVVYACKFAKIRKDGHIINLSSTSYCRGRKDYAVYSAAKAAIVNFTQAFAEESPHLYINALVPGRTDTKLRRENFPQENPQTLLQPKQVADQVLQILQRENTGMIFEIKK